MMTTAVLMMVMMVVAAMTDFGRKTIMHLAIGTVLMMAMIMMVVTMMMVKMLDSGTTGTIKPTSIRRARTNVYKFCRTCRG